MSNTKNKLMNINMSLYFKLTIKQRNRLKCMGYNHVLLEQVPYSDFIKITKNSKLHAELQRIKALYNTEKILTGFFGTPVKITG